ncbi:MAG TPA: hypothetical protein VMY80_03885 [Anaerolineae bacterium]|nr:hypothetical protein [Anaerolineae bacterium]
MSQRISPHTWVILGLGVALVAGFALLLAFLGREPGGPAPMITPALANPSPTVEQVAERATPTAQPPTPSPSTSPLSTPAAETLNTSPIPTPVLALPETAPDFTLEQTGGVAFTLSEQLAQGPVVLVFFRIGG